MSPMRRLGALALTACVLAPPALAQRAGDDARWRTRRAALADLLAANGITDSATVAAVRAVPRHEFVPADVREQSYEDYPLPIGFGQTISQPYVVALMTQVIRPRAGMKVLEVGTGSGYQAAILAEIGAQVWTVEIFEGLADAARMRLRRLGYRAVDVRHGDGYGGLPEVGPFDAIIVTAAADSVPPPLLLQLAPGGRLVMPLGPANQVQTLMVLEKDASGNLRERELVPVRFVPLLRGVR